MESWGSGDQIVIREVWRDRVWSGRPVTVVRDDADVLALWFPRGTTFMVPVTPPTRERAATRRERLVACLRERDWLLEERAWEVDTLWLLEEGAHHATWVSWLEDGSHWGWYVNFQEPYRRTARGIETFDLALDLLVEPDLSSWTWKDEDEFEAYIDAGVIHADLAARVRAEGEAVVERVRARAAPFGEPWPDWRAPEGWGLPELRAGWDARGA